MKPFENIPANVHEVHWNLPLGGFHESEMRIILHDSIRKNVDFLLQSAEEFPHFRHLLNATRRDNNNIVKNAEFLDDRFGEQSSLRFKQLKQLKILNSACK